MEDKFVTLEAGPPDANYLCAIFLRDSKGDRLPEDYLLAYFLNDKFHATGLRVGETFEKEQVVGYHYVLDENERTKIIHPIPN